MKQVLIISSSPRKRGNTQLLCEQFRDGAEAAGHSVQLIRLAEKKIGFCRACDACAKTGVCVWKDDMAELLAAFQRAEVLVLATPVYFYGVSAQMKTFLDRFYPIWRQLEGKEVYYIVAAGLGTDIIERSLGDLDGFVEHLKGSEVKGRLYAAHVMEAGLVQQTDLMQQAYRMGQTV